ncbi:hypothetical protein GCM10022223_24980 [Kineosporia mesophila]|uniref:Uncharacterized protein n=1 Tax=Kineosporia mesophila TaxID=566012 RepID=A0ABP6ZHM4_9ACTN
MPVGDANPGQIREPAAEHCREQQRNGGQHTQDHRPFHDRNGRFTEMPGDPTGRSTRASTIGSPGSPKGATTTTYGRRRRW